MWSYDLFILRSRTYCYADSLIRMCIRMCIVSNIFYHCSQWRAISNYRREGSRCLSNVEVWSTEKHLDSRLRIRIAHAMRIPFVRCRPSGVKRGHWLPTCCQGSCKRSHVIKVHAQSSCIVYSSWRTSCNVQYYSTTAGLENDFRHNEDVLLSKVWYNIWHVAPFRNENDV